MIKDDIIPKLEDALRAVPVRADNVSVFETLPGAVKHRTVTKVERKRETFSDKGLKAEEMELLGYDVVEITDFGLASRDMWNAIDRVQEYQQRVKQAINQRQQDRARRPGRLSVRITWARSSSSRRTARNRSHLYGHSHIRPPQAEMVCSL